jgi:hypothetical protein
MRCTAVRARQKLPDSCPLTSRSGTRAAPLVLVIRAQCERRHTGFEQTQASLTRAMEEVANNANATNMSDFVPHLLDRKLLMRLAAGTGRLKIRPDLGHYWDTDCRLGGLSHGLDRRPHGIPTRVTDPRPRDQASGASFDIVGCGSPQPDRSNQNNAGAAHRIDDAGEFRECPVAGSLDDAAPMLRDLRVNQFAAVRLEAVERTFLVRAHEARIAAASRRARITLYWSQPDGDRGQRRVSDINQETIISSPSGR